MSYLTIPLDNNGDYDIDKFTPDQLFDFYWDNPESIPDNIGLTC